MIKKNFLKKLILNNKKFTNKNINKFLDIAFLKSNLVVLKDNEIYRYGDFIKNKQSEPVILELLNNPIYNNTILKKYIIKKKIDLI